MATKPVRVLAFDISLSQPGAAVVEFHKGKAEIVAVSNCKTNNNEGYGSRAVHIQSWAHLFIRQNNLKSKPYNIILREKYAGKFNNHAIFSAWSAVDRALTEVGLEETYAPISQQTVKKLVVGKGRAEKSEVEEAVRKLTGYTGKFACDDESDAVAVALAWAIQNKVIKSIGE